MSRQLKDVVAVVHRNQGHTPYLHFTKLFVGDVPAEVGEDEIKERLEAAGHRFGEFGVKWANYYVVRLADAYPEVRGAWREHERTAKAGEKEEEPYVSWSDLSEETNVTEVLFLRVPSKLKEALTAKADAEKTSLNEYCARALASAAQ